MKKPQTVRYEEPSQPNSAPIKTSFSSNLTNSKPQNPPSSANKPMKYKYDPKSIRPKYRNLKPNKKNKLYYIIYLQRFWRHKKKKKRNPKIKPQSLKSIPTPYLKIKQGLKSFYLGWKTRLIISSMKLQNQKAIVKDLETFYLSAITKVDQRKNPEILKAR
jgi:hypothetical protein